MKILWNLLILCAVKSSLSKSSHKNEKDETSLEGDVLIKKILSAGTFNDLADKIVDKAIWRLNHQNSSSISTIAIEKGPGPEFKSTVDTTEVRLNKKGHKRHKPAIDVDAVLKNKVIPLIDLSFRYEHFTKGLNIHTSSESVKKIKDPNREWSNEGTDKETIKITKKSKAKNIEENEKSHSGEIITLNEKIKTETSSDILNFTKKEETTTPTFQSVENQFGDEKTIVWGDNDESGDKNSSDKSNEAEKKTRIKNRISDESTESYRNRAIDVKEPPTFIYNDDNRLKDEDLLEKAGDVNHLQSEHEEIKKKSKHLLRREGDRMFKFEESPDYVEYHEKLAEVRQMRSKNTEKRHV